MDAVRKRTIVEVGGVSFEYRIALVQRGDFFYQIIGWATESKFAEVESDLESIIQSFRLVEERQPASRANLVTADANGFGWLISDSVYSSVVTGLQLTPPDGCRLMGQKELENANPEASAGIVGGYGEFYQVWVVESAGDDNSLAEYYARSAAQVLGRATRREA